MDEQKASNSAGSTSVIQPNYDGTVKVVPQPAVVAPSTEMYSASTSTPAISTSKISQETPIEQIPSPYDSLDGDDSVTTSLSPTAAAQSVPMATAQASVSQTEEAPVAKTRFRDKDTNRVLVRLIAGALVVLVLLFGAGMIAGRLSDNRAVEPATQLAEQEITSVTEGEPATLGVQTSGTTLLVNGNVVATGSLQVASSGAIGTIVLVEGATSQTFSLPNASGEFCLDSNNCQYLQEADITTTTIAGVGGALLLGDGLALSSGTLSNTLTETSINGATGLITVQGNPNQIIISQNGDAFTFATAQDIANSSSPTFASITLSGVGLQNGNVLCDISNNCGYAGGTGAYIQDGNSFGETAVLGTNDAFDLAFETNGVTRIVVDTSGNTTVTGQILSANAGTTANPAFSFLFDEDTGLYRAADNSVGISTGGANNTTFNTNGVDIQGRVTIGDAAGAPGAAAGLLVQETFTAADSFCNFGCYGAQIIAIADNPLANNGLAALAVQAQTAATAFVQSNATGLFVGNTAAGAGSSITNGYGIRVNDQTGATNNYGIAIGTANTQALWIGNTADSTTASNGIGFGISRDTNLYRSAADTLRTDDTFISGTRIGINTSIFGTNNRLTVNANTTTDNLAVLQINTGATTNKGLVIQRSAGQTANLQEWQSSTGSVLTYIDASGFLNSPRFKENGNGVVIGGAASPQAGTNVLVESTGASNRALVVKGYTGQTGNLTEWQTSTSTVLGSIGATGAVLFQNSANSTNALRVLNAAGTATVLNVDTTNARLGVGTAAPQATGHLYTTNASETVLRVERSFDGVDGTIANFRSGSKDLNINYDDTGGGTAGNFEIQSSDAGYGIVLNSTSETNQLVVSSNGFVGINTTTPSVELEVTGDAIVSDRLQVGPSANTIGQCNELYLGALPCDAALEVTNSSTETAIPTYGIVNTVSITPAATNSVNNYGSRDLIFLSGANDFTGSSTGALGGSFSLNTTGTVASLIGVQGSSGILSAVPTTAVATQSIGLQASVGVSSAGGGTITTAYGIRVEAANVTGAGASIGENYGIYVNPQTAGGSDYGVAIGAADTQTLWLSSNADNTTAAAGIAFGSSRDTNLYRSAANTLRTDDALSVGDDITVTGDVLPSADDTYDLGSNSNRWRDLYLGPATLSIGTSVTDYKISYDTGGNTLLFNNDQADRDFRIAGVTQANLLYVDAGTSRVGIGTNTPGYELDVAGTLNASSSIYVGGSQVCTSGGCTASAGSGNYIQNGTVLQTANFNIQSASAASIGSVVKGAASQTAALQEWQSSAGTVLARITASGWMQFDSSKGITGTAGDGYLYIGDTARAGASGGKNLYYGSAYYGGYGHEFFGGSATNMTGVMLVTSSQASKIGLTVKGAASQTGDLQQWQNSSGTRLTSIESTGSLYSPTAPIKLGYNVELQGEYSTGGGFVNLIKRGSGNDVTVGNTTSDTKINANTYLDLTNSGGNGLRISSYNVNKYSSIGYLGSASAFWNALWLQPVNATSVAGTIRAQAAQSANLFEWQDSAGTVKTAIAADGDIVSTEQISVGNVTPLSGVRLSVYTNTDVKGLVVRGSGSQTANLQEWQNSAGSVLSYADANGSLSINNSAALTGATRLRVKSGTILSNTSTDGWTLNGVLNGTQFFTSETAATGSPSVMGMSGDWNSSTVSTLGTYGYLGGYFAARGSGSRTIIGSRSEAISTATISGDNIYGGQGIASFANPATATGGTAIGLQGVATTNTSSLGDRHIYGVNGQASSNGANTYAYGGSFTANGSGTNIALRAVSGATSTIGLVVLAAPSQTANLQEWRDSTGTSLAQVSSNGSLTLNNTAVDQRLTFTSSGISAGSIAWQTGSTTGYTLGKDVSGYFRLANAGAVSTRNVSFNGADGLLGINTQYPTTAALDVTVPASSRIGILVRGAASQTANLQEWQNSTGTILAYVDASGRSSFGSSSTSWGMQATASGIGITGSSYGGVGVMGQSLTNATVALVARGCGACSGDLQQWQSSTGTVLSAVNASGKLVIGSNAASTGDIRLSSTGSIQARNAANSGDLRVFEYNGSDNLIIGGGTSAGITAYTGSGSLFVQNSAAGTASIIVRGSASQTANLQEWQSSGGSVLSRVASNGYIYGPGFVSTGTAATSGYLRMANAENIAWRNGANSADYTFGLNASDQLVSSAPIWVNSDGAILYGRGGSGQARTVLSYNGSNEYLDLSSNGSVKLRLTSSYGAQFGAYSLTGGTNEKLRVNTPATVDNLANTIITASATTAKALVVQGLASQTANLQEWQDSTGTAIASINGGGVNGASGGILNVGYTGKSYRSFSVTQASRAADNDSYAVATFNATGAGDTYQNLGFNASMTGFNFSGPYGLTVRHSYSSVSAQFRSDGTKFGAGASSVATTPLGQVEIVSAAASTKGVVVRGAASQTANLQEWQSSAGTVLAAINPDGDLEVVDATVNGNLVVDGTATFNGNITVNGHVITGNTSGTTTVTAGAGAGTGASASIAGNDTSGKVTITTGTGSGAGAQATVTFANAYGAAPRVTLTPADGDGASIQYYAGSGTTTFTINSNNAPTDATAYEYYYQIME